MAKAAVLTRVEYRCIHCQLDLGDPDRQRSPFHLWLEAVRVHLLCHCGTAELKGLLLGGPLHAHIAAMYS